MYLEMYEISTDECKNCIDFLSRVNIQSAILLGQIRPPVRLSVYLSVTLWYVLKRMHTSSNSFQHLAEE